MRDDFSAKTKRILAARVGYHRSNPTCVGSASGPALDEDRTVSTWTTIEEVKISNPSVRASEERFLLPDGREYMWSDVHVTLEITATLVVPDSDQSMTLTRTFTGEDATVFLVELLKATA